MTLELRSVGKGYPGFSLGPLDGSFDDGVTALLGPSGSGKTTLLKLIAGFERGTGEVRLDDRRIDGLPPEERGIGMVFQSYALFPHLDVRENIGYGAGEPGDVDEFAEMLEIGHLLDRSPGTLSGGEKQRVALARTLCSGPGALLLDEPLSSLDAPIRERLRHELRPLLVELDIPVLYVTHDQEEALVLGDRIAVLGDGEFHQVGAPREVLKEPGNRFVASFMGARNVFDGEVAGTDGDHVVVAWEGGEVEAPGDVAPGEAVEFCIRPEDIMIIREGKPLRENIRENLYDGSVSDRVDRGGTHLIDVVLDGGARVQIEIPDHAYHRLDMDSREQVTVSFKRDRVHLMEA